MKDLKKQYHTLFDKVELDSNKSIALKENIKTKYYKRQKIKKMIYSIIVVFTVAIISVGVSYADDIKNTFNGMAIKIGIKKNLDKTSNHLKIDSKGVKEINYDADIREEICEEGFEDKCENIYTLKEVEEKLNIKLLRSDLFKRDIYSAWKVVRNEQNKIMNLHFRMINALDIHPNYKGYYKIKPTKEGVSPWMHIDYNILLKTKYFKGDDSVWRQTGWLGDDVKNYYIKALNTTAIGLCFGKKRWIFFEYDDVVYHFRISVIDKKNPDKEVEYFLNTLHY